MQFKVIADFWRRGNLVEAGTVVEMNEVESRYLRHALEPVVADPAAEPAAEHVEEVAAEAPAERPTPEFEHRRPRKGRINGLS